MPRPSVRLSLGAALLSAVLLAACNDSLTDPALPGTSRQSTGDAKTQDVNLGTYCDPDPTIGCTVVGGSPTGSYDPSPCTSVTCGTSGGSTGGSTGGGSTSTTTTSYKPSTADDDMGQSTVPDCSDPSTWSADWHAPYCKGYAPTGTLLDKFNGIMNTMTAKGGICAELAQYGRDLLSQNKVRYYNSSDGILKGWGSSGIGIIVDREFVNNSRPYNHALALAHELEHAYTGYKHTATDVDANGVNHTPNDTNCSK